jgi:hypothetical protein
MVALHVAQFVIKGGDSMMNAEQYEELEKIRLQYKKKKQSKLEKQRALKDCQNRLSKKVNKLKLDLKFKKADMLNNKELRAEHGFTSDTAWKKGIDKLTLEDEQDIELIEQHASDKIKGYERDIEDLNIEIGDLHWELTIKLEYFKDSQPGNVYVEQVGIEAMGDSP